MAYPDRNRVAQLGQETVRILEAGEYLAPSGRVVSIRDALSKCVADTREYRPEQALAALPLTHVTRTDVVRNGSTLQVAHEFVTQGYKVAALNFASARHPGGGFLGGARAQEESLARSSGLYACLRGREMYAHHERVRDPMYTSWTIYSPDVPVFRDDSGTLLETPWLCSFITCPAVNAKVVLERDTSRRAEITTTMGHRIARVLAIAALQAHDTLVLGAWGCGVFGNDPANVARLFADALAGSFARTFARVSFAILDSSPDNRTIGPFAKLFGTPAHA